MNGYNDELFRLQFPAFADKTKFPEPMIQLYWNMAMQFCTLDGSPYATINGDTYILVMNMLTAHLLQLGTQQKKGAGGASASGGNGGGGFTTSATIGEVSVAKLAPPVKDGWEWWLAQTTYGQMLWAMLDLKAVGGFSVGGLPEREGFRKIGGLFL